MTLLRSFALLLVLAAPAAAQDDGSGALGLITQDILDEEEERFDPKSVIGEVITTRAEAGRVQAAPGAILRTLDKISGSVEDITIPSGGNAKIGRIDVSLFQCRYPAANPSGNAYAYLEVFDAGETAPAFRGWMIAASPALNALDHPRYDVWVMRCTTS